MLNAAPINDHVLHNLEQKVNATMNDIMLAILEAVPAHYRSIICNAIGYMMAAKSSFLFIYCIYKQPFYCQLVSNKQW
jgi:hypothetical protein